MAYVRSNITGEVITLKNFFDKLKKSFIKEYDGKKITLDDIKSWSDNDDVFEAVELNDGEPTVEYMKEYNELYNQYVNECKEYFELGKKV